MQWKIQIENESDTASEELRDEEKAIEIAMQKMRMVAYYK